ncbi:MAG TPA: hypothetical protein VE996_00630 [Terriglobales bacterium]|nr:hypothetical protein [Terriglobales bacterium]
MSTATEPRARPDAGLRAWARGQWRRLAALTVASAALAAFFGRTFGTVTDDGRLYLQLAHNLLRTGHYTRLFEGHWIASTARLPGYPLLLAAVYRFAPWGRLAPLFALQWLLLAATAAAAAWLARLVAPREAEPAATGRAMLAAFGLVALCPFLSMYTAVVLSEVPATLCTTVAIGCGLAALRAREGDATAPPSHRELAWWAGSGGALAAGILLRPDTGVVLLVLSVPLWRGLGARRRRGWRPLALLVAIALAPLAAWTVRNWVELGVFRPLVTAEATEVGEPQHPGFDRWALTWLAGYRGVEDVLDNVPGAAIDPAMLPSRALGRGPARAQTLALIAAYNRDDDLTPGLDAAFGRLAAARIRRHPLRFFLLLPLARMTSLWFSPRIEFLPLDDHWWPPGAAWENDARDFSVTAGFLLLNAAYLALALWGLWAARPRYRALLVGLAVARTAALGAYISCEPRYVLELYPLVLVWAAWGAVARFGRRARPAGGG